MAGEEGIKRGQLRVLCLHGFRTSGAILEAQFNRWDKSILELLHLTFLDAQLSSEGPSQVEGIFPPPYYEWYRFNSVTHEYTGLVECISYISDYMKKHGPFDGLMGFSQGAYLVGALAGMQQKGLALQHHPKLHFVLIISGGLLMHEQWRKDCYSEKIKCPSLHFIGSNDFLKESSEELLNAFENPVVVRHGGKHAVPRLGEDMVLSLTKFLMQFLEKSSEQSIKLGAEIEESTCEAHGLGYEVDE